MRKALKIVLIMFGVLIGIPAVLGIAIWVVGLVGDFSKPEWEELAKMQDADDFKEAISDLKDDSEINSPVQFYNCGSSCEGDTFSITLAMERKSLSSDVTKDERLTDQSGDTDINFEALNVSWEKIDEENVGNVSLPSGNLKIDEDVLKYSKFSILGTYLKADGMVGDAKAKGIVTGFEVTKPKELAEAREKKRIAKKKRQEWLAFKSKALESFQEGYEYTHFLPSMGACTPRHSKDKCISNDDWIKACKLMVGNGENTRELKQAEEDQMRSALLAIPYNSGMKKILKTASIKTFGAKTLGVDTGFNPPRCVGVATLAWKIGSTEITKSIRGAPVSFKRVGDKIIFSCYHGTVVEWMQRLMSDNPSGRGMSAVDICKNQVKK
jgi:hypothetical protein